MRKGGGKKLTGRGPRRGGRPRGKPLSPVERAQRRAAALKHGEYAQTALGQALPPCKPATCLNGGTGTCDLKKAVEQSGGGLSACLVSLGHETTLHAYLEALRTGGLQGLQELTAASLAGQAILGHAELAKLLTEGLVIDQPIVGRTEDGGTAVLGHRPAENPRAANTFRLLQQLGHTAADQVLTPKSRGEKNRDEGLGRAGHAAWVAQMRTNLLTPGEDDPDE
jgi:hypothetical protein